MERTPANRSIKEVSTDMNNRTHLYMDRERLIYIEKVLQSAGRWYIATNDVIYTVGEISTVIKKSEQQPLPTPK